MSRRHPLLPALAILGALLLGACGDSRPADRVATLYWDAMRERDFVMLEGVTTQQSQWALDEAVYPLMGVEATLAPERAEYGEDEVRIPTRLDRAGFPGWPPIEFSTVLARDTDGYRVDLDATLEAYRDGARQATEQRFTYVAERIRTSFETAADDLMARIETIRGRLAADLHDETAALTRALRDEVDDMVTGVTGSAEQLLQDMARSIDRLRAELDAMRAPEEEDAAASAAAGAAADAEGDVAPDGSDGDQGDADDPTP